MKKVKSVAFNVADPMEMALYNHALKHKYFSTYIKRLIMRDLEHGQQTDLSEFYKSALIYDKEEES
jgi:hypothetical protein